jgi:hypothetical protein
MKKNLLAICGTNAANADKNVPEQKAIILGKPRSVSETNQGLANRLLNPLSSYMWI